MAVAFGAACAATAPATSSSYNSGNITPSGTNLVLVCAISLTDVTATVTSVTWSVDSGVFTEVKNVRAGSIGGLAYTSIWVYKAPATGLGHAAIVLSASVAHQTDLAYFTGADQTTPCPTGDAVTSALAASGVTSVTLTPTNLTSADASYGQLAHTVDGDVTSVTPNQTFLDDTTAINAEAGYATGTASVVFNRTSSAGNANIATVAVRIVAAAGTALPPGLGPDLKMDIGSQSAIASMMR